MDTLPICKAKSKQAGRQCRNFSMKGKSVCHIHGGKSTGAKTVIGRYRQKISSLKHGLRSQEGNEKAKKAREMINECKNLLGAICANYF